MAQMMPSPGAPPPTGRATGLQHLGGFGLASHFVQRHEVNRAATVLVPLIDTQNKMGLSVRWAERPESEAERPGSPPVQLN